MQFIIISFTLKGQDFWKIKNKLQDIAKQNPDAILIHGFMPRKEVISKGFSTDVLDTLDTLFPIQLNMYKDGKPMREEMVKLSCKLNASIYFIGEIKEGVLEEHELYTGNKDECKTVSGNTLNLHFMPL